jgi:hypothetical protein
MRRYPSSTNHTIGATGASQQPEAAEHDTAALAAEILPAYTVDNSADPARRPHRSWPPRQPNRRPSFDHPNGPPPHPDVVLVKRSLSRRHLVVAAIVAAGITAAMAVVETSSRTGRADSPATSPSTDPAGPLAIASSTQDAPCWRLIQIGAAALGVDPDNYGPVVAGISTIEASSYNDFVHQQLSAALAARELAAPDGPHPDFTGLQGALADAISRADTTPCPTPVTRTPLAG